MDFVREENLHCTAAEGYSRTSFDFQESTELHRRAGGGAAPKHCLSINMS
jgi:hypothetical protein